MSDQNLIAIFAKVFAAYNLFLIVASTVLNTIILYVCVRSKRLRANSTFKIIAFTAVIDFLACLVWNEESFTGTFFDFQPYFRSFFYCRWISMFLQYTSCMLESWLLVSISLDRFLSVIIKRWSKYYFNGYKPIIYSFLLTLVILGVNINELFTNGYVTNVNGTEYINCFMNRDGEFNWYKLMAQVSDKVLIF